MPAGLKTTATPRAQQQPGKCIPPSPSEARTLRPPTEQGRQLGQDGVGVTATAAMPPRPDPRAAPRVTEVSARSESLVSGRKGREWGAKADPGGMHGTQGGSQEGSRGQHPGRLSGVICFLISFIRRLPTCTVVAWAVAGCTWTAPTLLLGFYPILSP